MKFLILDTCGSEGGVAVAASEKPANLPLVLVGRVLAGQTYASGLITAVREVLKECELALADMDAIVVTRGPGSFTGMRVGLSVAKGLAHASGMPVIALSRLAVMAVVVSGEARTGEGPIFVAMDAGRNEFYLGQYRNAGEVCVEETLISHDELKVRVQAAKVFVYEEKAAQILAGLVDVVQIRQPVPVDCIPMAARAFVAEQFASLAELDANYLRMTYADGKKQAPHTGKTQ